MVRLYKLSIGDVFCVDANKWIKQYGDVMFPYAYVESTDGTSIKLELMGIEKNQNQASLVAVLEIEKENVQI